MMSMKIAKKEKQTRVEEEMEVQEEVTQDVNSLCFYDTKYKNGAKICPNWYKLYRYFQRKEYLVYQLEFSSLDNQDDIEKDDCVAYKNIRKSKVYQVACRSTVLPFDDPINWILS